MKLRNSRHIRIVIFVLCKYTALCAAQSVNSTASVSVHVTNVRSAKGVVKILLFRGADGFPSSPLKAFREQLVQIGANGEVQGTFNSVPEGTYAIAAFHDENSNGKLDKNMVGRPKEGYGFSNDPGKKMRPARFDEASFEVRTGRTVDIKLVY